MTKRKVGLMTVNALALIKQLTALLTAGNQTVRLADKTGTRTVRQMIQLTCTLADDYQALVNRRMLAAARVVSRPIYERGVFLLFILHDHGESVSRAQLFYHSSRLRQYLWTRTICAHPDSFMALEPLASAFAAQDGQCWGQHHMSLASWLAQRIDDERTTFNALEQKAQYCDLASFGRDDRRKTWYRTDPEVWGHGPKISSIADVARFVLGDQHNYCHLVFYGLNSLFTHGYYLPEVLIKDITGTSFFVAGLLDAIVAAVFKEGHPTNKERRQFHHLHQQVMGLFKAPTVPQWPRSAHPERVVRGTDVAFMAQARATLDAYRWLRKEGRNQAARVLFRTLNEQWVSIRWIKAQPTNEAQRALFNRFVLTARLQLVRDVRRFVTAEQAETLTPVVETLTDTLVQAAIPVMNQRTLRRDKQHRNWLAIEQGPGKHARSFRAVERMVVPHGTFAYQYANGFHSVHAHGINLNLPFFMDDQQTPLFLLGDSAGMKINDQVVADLVSEVE
ncbi:hypothetical protein ACI3E1_00130 [Ligilactobacillus sp. LYQ139]|uniref:hypothetical protein n=1 Tax=Ligilactobacillus sp. LYQ139 TaxID=3378800 RepID=UPI0038535CD5